jgi:hypothetical protein
MRDMTRRNSQSTQLADPERAWSRRRDGTRVAHAEETLAKPSRVQRSHHVSGQFRTRQNMITVEFQGRHMANELTGSAATAEVFLARAMLSKLVRAAHGH